METWRFSCFRGFFPGEAHSAYLYPGLWRKLALLRIWRTRKWTSFAAVLCSEIFSNRWNHVFSVQPASFKSKNSLVVFNLKSLSILRSRINICGIYVISSGHLIMRSNSPNLGPWETKPVPRARAQFLSPSADRIRVVSISAARRLLRFETTYRTVLVPSSAASNPEERRVEATACKRIYFLLLYRFWRAIPSVYRSNRWTVGKAL